MGPTLAGHQLTQTWKEVDVLLMNGLRVIVFRQDFNES